MLSRFKVTNFKGFNTEFVFDLNNTNNYGFNSESIVNGIVNSALIYGHNGVGKSNLGLALFDIVGHVTDKEVNENLYSPYSNALNDSKISKFYYEFLFTQDEVIYEYEKSNVKTPISEKLIINGVELASIDRKVSDTATINFKGAETLNKELSNKNLSLLKYIKSNSQLEKNRDSEIFFELFEFLDGILFFRSLDNNVYLGLETGSRGIEEDIIERDNVQDLELFLNAAGVECKLKVEKEFERDVIAFDFNGKTISFYDIASTGTKSLTLFYYWLQRLREEGRVKFVFIDEFDAFYHHELSALIVKELKKTGIQFILTSHNTSIITNDLLRPDCYFLMKKDNIRSLAKCTSKELREAHNIEKMYKAGSFDGE